MNIFKEIFKIGGIQKSSEGKGSIAYPLSLDYVEMFITNKKR